MAPEERDLETDLRARLRSRVLSALESAEAAVARARALQEGRRLARDPETLMRRCAWCDRVSLADEWLDPEEAERIVGRRRDRLQVSHTICPDCAERLVQEGKSR